MISDREQPPEGKISSLQASEKECAAHAVAPRVSLDDIKAAIRTRYEFNAWEAMTKLGLPVPIDAALGVLSICILVMQNGFTILGKSAPASPKNFNAELGKKLAHEDAIRQLWPLMGYALRDKLSAG